MFWKDVIETYGSKTAALMENSEMLCCVTVELKDGEWDYPERDIDLAFRDVTGQHISPLEWD